MTRPPTRFLRRVALPLAIAALGGAAVLGPAVPAAAVTAVCDVARSALDLNADGYDDAVVGDPYATVAGRAEAGAVVVLYGDGDGRVGEGRRLLITQGSVNGSRVEAGDRFGWAVALDDADGDGCADLLVGSPGETWAGQPAAGIAHLITFTADGRGGPGTGRARVFADREVESGDQFGYAVALLDGGSGSEDAWVAIGAPGEDVGAARDAGAVTTFGYSELGVSDSGYGVQGGSLPGTAEAGDRLGAAVLVTPEEAFVVGAPGDAVRRGGVLVDGAGSVTSWNPLLAGHQVLTQESAGVPGTAEAGDQFGASLAFSESDRRATGPQTLAVGSPGEDVGRVADAGSVTLLDDQPGTDADAFGSLRGLRTLTQDSPGVAGGVEAGDRFGHAVTFVPDTATAATLAVGAPYEDVGTATDAGMVSTVSVVGESRQGVAGPGYTESSPGTPGTVARGNRFGLAVSAIEGRNESLLAVASPYQQAGSVFVVARSGGVDRPRAWLPGRGDVPALTSGRFGWALSGRNSQEG